MWWRWPRVTDWSRAWSLDGEELALLRYVRPAEVARQVQLPGPSGEGIAARLAAVYGRLAAVGIGYCAPVPGATAGTQLIRPPEQVLWAPRHATCLDLAVVLAGACVTAGLHPAIVVLDPPHGPGVGHSLVLVRLDHGLAPRTDGRYGDDVWHEPPPGLLDDLQHSLADGLDGDVLAIDPVGFAATLGTTSIAGLQVDFAQAVAHGARYLTSGRWRLGVDVGRAWRDDGARPVALPGSEPLRAPYRGVDTAESPLRLLRAEYELVAFRSRDELTLLREWCREITTGAATGIAVITGTGGAGKTRLGLELAALLSREGWYAGTLPKNPDGVGWLATVVSPVLVMLDYADGRVQDAITLLQALRGRVGRPAVVVLTARSVEGQWLHDIIEALDSDGHVYRQEPIGLPDLHPDAGDVYRRTVAALTTGPVDPPRIPAGIRWTTLDFVLLGWIAAQGATTLPTTPGELYDEVLRHEQNYWSTVYRDNITDRRPHRTRLRKAATCLSLVAAPEAAADTVLEAVDDLRRDPRELHDVRDTLITCLAPGAGEGIALRPDPVGDHLVLTELRHDEPLLRRAVAAAGDAGVTQAVTTLVRAGHNDLHTATRLITSLVEADLERWTAVLAVAAAQGGAAAASLEQLVGRDDNPLPLDRLSEALPFSPFGLYDLALLVEQQRLSAARRTDPTDVELAELLERVSARAGHAGDQQAALGSITEAVDIGRRLAAANPAAYLPDLATSLNNLSDRFADADQPEAAEPVWRGAVESLRQPAARAELRAAWARRLDSTGHSDRAVVELNGAVADADEPVVANGSGDQLALVVVMRARNAVRLLVQAMPSSPTDFPEWAAAPIPTGAIDLVNAYTAADRWPDRQAALDAAPDVFTSAGFRTALTALAGLYPANPVPAELLTLLDEINDSGIADVFARRRVDHDRRALLDAWIATPTWAESRTFLAAHRDELHTPQVPDLLAGIDDNTARQHLAILDLTRGVLPDEQVYGMVTGPPAEETALDTIEAGDLPLLAAVLVVAPGLSERPVTWQLAAAVLLLAQGQPEQAREYAQAAADQATPIQRRAHTVRLRALAAHQPDMTGVEELIAIMTAPTAAS